jgi:hypothetical protein
MQDLLYKNSANLLIIQDLVDWFDRDAAGNPTPITSGVSVTARIYEPTRTTAISAVIVLTQEADQAQNMYRGIAPKTVDLNPYSEVSIKFMVDGASDGAYLERWKDVKVVEE